ncbi:MAG: DUF6950 family protein [Cetobacterium sp.]
MTPEKFLIDRSCLPHRYGENDCAMVAAVWVKALTGKNPMQTVQTPYNELLNKPGGLPIAVARVMRAAGFKRTKNPVVGDIGVLFGGAIATTAIKGSNAWIWLDSSGRVSGIAHNIAPVRFAFDVMSCQQ